MLIMLAYYFVKVHETYFYKNMSNTYHKGIIYSKNQMVLEINIMVYDYIPACCLASFKELVCVCLESQITDNA